MRGCTGSTDSITPAGGRLTQRIFLSPPDVGPLERQALLDAFDSNWIAPLGPDVDAFEAEFAARVGVSAAAALSSGTAGLHLGLVLLGVGPGDEVFVPTLTFAATANAVVYVGARPVFIDCDPATWTLDPKLLQATLEQRAHENRLPKAVVAVDLYGQCADYDALRRVCDAYSIPLVQDAAEALGAEYRDQPAGSQASLAVFSFNGNKIITTSGGGMLVSNDSSLVARARKLASQAREPAIHYEHREIGYNYRMSNLLAALGRAQLASLGAKVERRRRNFEAYRSALSRHLEFMPEAPYGRGTRWLTCALCRTSSERDAIIDRLAEDDIEARPVWKPLHEQPVFASCASAGGSVAADLFRRGVCLPSGSNLSSDDLARVIHRVEQALQLGRHDTSRDESTVCADASTAGVSP